MIDRIQIVIVATVSVILLGLFFSLRSFSLESVSQTPPSFPLSSLRLKASAGAAGGGDEGLNYTSLYKQEFGEFTVKAIQQFLTAHRGMFLSAKINHDILISKGSSMKEYREALRVDGVHVRPVRLAQIVSIVSGSEPRERAEGLRRLTEIVEETLATIEAAPVPAEARDFQQRYVAATVGLRNALRQMSQFDVTHEDPIGQLLAAESIDQLVPHFLALAQEGRPVFFPGKDEEVQRVAGAMELALHLPQVAGATTRNPSTEVCGLCLPLDELLVKGAAGI